jgi:hypothetical protein
MNWAVSYIGLICWAPKSSSMWRDSPTISSKLNQSQSGINIRTPNPQTFLDKKKPEAFPSQPEYCPPLFIYLSPHEETTVSVRISLSSTILSVGSFKTVSTVTSMISGFQQLSGSLRFCVITAIKEMSWKGNDKLFFDT